MPGEIERPQWLSESYLRDIYSEQFKSKNVNVEILKCSGVADIGDNYVSKMYRLRVRVTGGEPATFEDSLIIKSMEDTHAMIKEYGIFQIEAQMYEKVLPVFSEYFRNVGVDIQFGPRCLRVETEPHDVLILSDLNDKNYFMENRFEKLDVKHAEATLSKLAKFHAASVLYKEKNKTFGSLLDRKFMDAQMALFMGEYMKNNYSALNVALKSMGFDQEILNKFQNLPNTYVEDIIRITNPDCNPDDFHVLAHADLWLNNQLYHRNNKQEVDDVLFIDFQASYWGNPITDIYYFLLSSIKPEILVEKLDYFIYHYHENLIEAMALLKVQQKPPTLKQFHLQMMRSGFYASTLIADIIPIVVMERHKDANLDVFIGDPQSEGVKSFRNKMFNNPRFEHAAKTLIPFLDSKGYLDSSMKKGDLPEWFKKDTQELQAKMSANPITPPPQQKSEASPKINIKVEPYVAADVPQNKSKIQPRILDRIKQLTNSTDTNGYVNGGLSDKAIVANGIPKWLNKFFFRDILLKEGQAFKIVTFNIGAGNAKGENYASVMLRANMKVETSEGLVSKEYVVKVNHQSEMSEEMLEMFNVFPKEIEMYTEIVPAFQRIFSEIEPNMIFGPRCVFGGTKPADCIVLEDLRPLGYVNTDRKAGLDLAHSELILEKLAKFHAASVIYMERGNSFSKTYNEGIFADHIKPFFENFVHTIPIMQEVANKSWKCNRLLTDLFANWREKLVDKMFSVGARDNNDFNVLCHGDLWSNNVLFKYNEQGKPDHCIFVDYQMCFHSSPVLDLHYFLVTSVKPELKFSHLDHFLEFYHRHLITSLRQLGYCKKLPTLLQLQVDFLKKGFFGIGTAFVTLPIIIADGGDDASPDNLMKNDEAANAFKRRVYGNPRFGHIMDTIIPFYDKKGILA